MSKELLEEAYHFVRAAEQEAPLDSHLQYQARDLRKRIDAALNRPAPLEIDIGSDTVG